MLRTTVSTRAVRTTLQRLWRSTHMSLALLAAGACDGSPGEMGELDGGSVIDAGGSADAGSEPTGFRSLYIGHSFFRPFAVSMEEHAERAGVAGHSQDVVFAGGPNGAPMALWNDENKRAEIQAVLDGGDVELFVMTYHSDHPTIEGYEKWFDYALAQNPNTRFALALPWLPYPETIADAATYESTWHAAHSTSWHDFIDTLRELYPGTEVFCIPYGQSAVELRLLFEAGELSDVSAMTGPASDAIYTDPLGHAGEILVDLGELVWLRAIYGVDLSTYDYDHGYEADLAAVAREISDAHDPSYDATYR